MTTKIEIEGVVVHNLVYEYDYKDGYLGFVDEVEQDYWELRVMPPDRNSFVIGCSVKELSITDCYIKMLDIKDSSVGIRKLRPLLEYLGFNYINLKRGFDSEVHRRKIT